MIRKASELLGEFIEAEKRKLDGFNMSHMPTLGSAYEEITKQGIYQDFAIPKHLDLRVVSGFISVGGEMLDEQIDCMLVHGDGERYGLTQQYKYDINSILCIFEVKKNLRKVEYADAMHHLAKIRRKFADNFEERLINEGYRPDISNARRRFSQLTGKVAPEEYLDIHNLSKSDGILFYTLVQESLSPITIIHGYEGYKTENGLRTAFSDILEEAWKSGHGWGVPSIPTLVTSNNFCLVKGSGIPFLLVQNKNEWISVFSTRHNSAKLILELIWSKIGEYFNVKMPWGDGLHMDSVQPLLIAEAKEIEGGAGWAYRTQEFKEKHMVRDDDNLWSPSRIGKAEIASINIMAVQGGYLLLDNDMREYLIRNHGVTIEQVADALISTREFMRDGGYIRPIHPQTYVITNKDETGFVASEIERFDLWCAENEVEPSYMSIYLMND
ncbi:hypothetical protein LT706_09690 [Pseudomonas syringae pv. syringae]|uniref:DUF6602 domain-containing protein n=1 Tax=Pseudomonas TaxID=286 RepID=UPI0006B9AC29|nr:MULTISPECIES: DUF6602 domain-containing protein [Pseudomonas]KPB24765.1 Uncharacterized protein AC517_3692 [Pseudomonas syringae pv. syringae]MCK9711801.1 hypothetical protein [Pseudomonas syringae pv. syringae]SFW42577.1 hypothetical protein SAMN03159505_01469 [Pseudomonas sp. NFACC10-1]